MGEGLIVVAIVNILASFIVIIWSFAGAGSRYLRIRVSVAYFCLVFTSYFLFFFGGGLYGDLSYIGIYGAVILGLLGFALPSIMRSFVKHLTSRSRATAQ